MPFVRECRCWPVTGAHDKRPSRPAPRGALRAGCRLAQASRRTSPIGGPAREFPWSVASCSRSCLVAGARPGRAVAPVAAVAATYSAPLDRAIADLPVARRGAHRLLPGPLPALDRRRRRRVQHPRRGADRGGRRPGRPSGRLRAERRPLVLLLRPRVLDRHRPASTSTTWSRSPRPGTRVRGTGRRRTRQAFANDLGDRRSLVGVTDSVNQSKGDQDPAEWMPSTAPVATCASGSR